MKKESEIREQLFMLKKSSDISEWGKGYQDALEWVLSKNPKKKV
jgi:hypothetical protein